MYAQYFGLKHEPFSIAPDPRYLFMSERHREALAHLLYGVKGGGGGFVLLTGEIGAGKTTVCRCLLEQVPKRCNVAYIFNPRLTALELLKTVCDEFRVPVHHEGPGVPTVKDHLDPLNRYLLDTHAVGQNNVLIVDEAQNLPAGALEQLRLLTNLETNERKLLQVVLIGQPELREMLQRPELEQVAQRVIARYHLGTLTEDETEKYLRHRLAVAGLTTALPFTKGAMRRIHARARGVPRRINLLADRALLGTYAEGAPRVDERIVDKAALEVFGPDERAERLRRARPWLVGATAGAVLAAGAAVALWPRDAAAPAAPLPLAAASAPKGASAPAQPGAASAVAAAPVASSAPAEALTAAAAASAPALAPAALLAAAEAAARAAGGWREADAWRELAPLWGLVLPPGRGDPCVAVQRAQWQCVRNPAAGMPLVRQLDRPGLVTLRDSAGRPLPAVLTALGPQGATLRVGRETLQVGLVALATLWQGDFATYWRAPEGYDGVIDEGASGAAVDLLAGQLAQWRGEPAPPAGQRFDAALRRRVQAFQLAQGLAVDGRAGPTTFMQLARASGGAREPRLQP
ncbi:MAG TPA: AAA family ATPase [Burkholderiaceae bacterium]|nr:AAA family ATPase [Burkholderiaceae bacterium]